MTDLVQGINNFFWSDPNPGRLSGSIGLNEVDLRSIVTPTNTTIIYEIGSTSYRSFNPANPGFAPFKALSPDKAYLIETKTQFTLPGILLPTDDLTSNPNPTPVTFEDTLTATGIENTVNADGISLVGVNGDSLRYNSLTGSQIPCSMSLYLNSISAENQVASIGFPAVYAGQRFAYSASGTVYDNSNLIFKAGGEIVLSA